LVAALSAVLQEVRGAALPVAVTVAGGDPAEPVLTALRSLGIAACEGSRMHVCVPEGVSCDWQSGEWIFGVSAKEPFWLNGEAALVEAGYYCGVECAGWNVYFVFLEGGEWLWAVAERRSVT
jgi:hypothetical protein